jgi:hypothetical protein
MMSFFATKGPQAAARNELVLWVPTSGRLSDKLYFGVRKLDKNTFITEIQKQFRALITQSSHPTCEILSNKKKGPQDTQMDM